MRASAAVPSPSVVSSIPSRGSRSAGGSGSVTRTAILESGGVPRGFGSGGARSTLAARTSRRTPVRSLRRRGPPQASMSIGFVAMHGSSAMESQRSRPAPVAVITRRRVERRTRTRRPASCTVLRARRSQMSPSRSPITSTLVEGPAAARSTALSYPSSPRRLSWSSTSSFFGSGSRRKSASRWNRPRDEPPSLKATPTWAAMPRAPEPPPPMSTRPSVAFKPRSFKNVVGWQGSGAAHGSVPPSLPDAPRG